MVGLYRRSGRRICRHTLRDILKIFQTDVTANVWKAFYNLNVGVSRFILINNPESETSS